MFGVAGCGGSGREVSGDGLTDSGVLAVEGLPRFDGRSWDEFTLQAVGSPQKFLRRKMALCDLIFRKVTLAAVGRVGWRVKF